MASAASRRLIMSIPLLFATLPALLALLHAASCSPLTACDSDVVYSYGSNCYLGPVRYGATLYIVSSQFGDGGITYEYDETNNTDYLRLTGSPYEFGSRMTLLPEPYDSTALGTPVAWNDTVRVYYFKLTRDLPVHYWGWRQESGTEWFLERTPCYGTNDTCSSAVFRVVHASDVAGPFPCNRAAFTRCQSFYLLSTPGEYSSGLARYVEDGVSYITLGDEGSNGDLPIVFLPASNNELPKDKRARLATALS